MAMIDKLDMMKLIEIVMSEKVGRGIDFLPQKTEDLKKKLCDLGTSYTNEELPELNDKILTVLDELLFRKAIKKRKYNDILKDMN